MRGIKDDSIIKPIKVNWAFDRLNTGQSLCNLNGTCIQAYYILFVNLLICTSLWIMSFQAQSVNNLVALGCLDPQLPQLYFMGL